MIEIFFVLLLLIIIVALFIYRATFTPYGRLTLNSAITAKKYSLLNFFLDDSAPLTPARRARAHAAMIKGQGKATSIYKTEDLSITAPNSDIPIRLYWPRQKEKLSVLVFYHGGGFAYGNLDTHDNLCRKLAKITDHLVVAVDYRLAPEHPYPAAIDDGYSALQWVADNIKQYQGNPGKISIAGESAGGNVAAVVAMMARDRSGPTIHHQVLLYPMLEADHFESGSYHDLATGFMLTTASTKSFWRAYAGELTDWKEPYFSPASASNLSNLPPALIITAEFDPLRDGGEHYAKKLEQAGNKAQLHRAKGVLHGFIMSPGQKPGPEAQTALMQACEQLSG